MTLTGCLARIKKPLLIGRWAQCNACGHRWDRYPTGYPFVLGDMLDDVTVKVMFDCPECNSRDLVFDPA